MKRVRILWGVLLSSVILLAALAGAASARPVGAPLSIASKTLTVPAADCYPWSDDADYFNGAYYLRSMTGLVSFICPARFPDHGIHQVQSVTMYVQDTDSTNDMCVEVNRMDPSSGTYTKMGEKCSSGSAPSGVRSIPITVSAGTVNPTEGVYFWVTMKASLKLKLYGFRISYDISP